MMNMQMMQQWWYESKKKSLISFSIFQEAQQWNPSPLVWWGWQDLTGPEVPLSEWQPEEERWSPGWYPSLLPLRPVSRLPCQIQTFVLMLLSLMKKEEFINVVFLTARKFTPNLHIWKPIKELTQVMNSLENFAIFQIFQMLILQTSKITFSFYINLYPRIIKWTSDGPIFKKFNLSLDTLKHVMEVSSQNKKTCMFFAI